MGNLRVHLASKRVSHFANVTGKRLRIFGMTIWGADKDHQTLQKLKE